ncbi:thiolase family protein [Parahaliea maris]|uniref:Thiolase family protein n=1 Tax=Parahaliea maris TaxID=2716870 RepID=A0A5C9A3J7_9GAMM|nr:thiolase family protein [Parahaliea maris]TXS95286.1 thiolase family protein [Parahaliea maris]
MTDVAIIGVGLHPFGRTPDRSGLDQGVYAVREALKDAGIQWKDVQVAYGGSMDGGDAEAIVNQLGLTSLQFTNIWNGCATGGSSLSAAHNAIKAGAADIALAVGFDKHSPGAFNPDPASLGLPAWYGETGMMLTPQFFAMKLQRYMHEHAISVETLSLVAEKAFHNGSLNPGAWRRHALSREDIASSPMVCDPLRKYMFCSPAEGGAALILCRGDIARRYTTKPVWLKAAVVRGRHYGSFEVYSPCIARELAPSATVTAARDAFELAGIGPGDVDVLQLQDTESGAEIMHMAENGFCEHGEQEHLIRSGVTAIGGAMPVNTDGGCLANGEPIGASGLRQIYEICIQLRGQAGKRQVPNNPQVGYTHVYGAPGVSGVTVLQR